MGTATRDALLNALIPIVIRDCFKFTLPANWVWSSVTRICASGIPFPDGDDCAGVKTRPCRDAAMIYRLEIAGPGDAVLEWQ